MAQEKRKTDFKEVFEALDPIFYDIISGNNGVHAKQSLGSTNPVEVRRLIRADGKWLKTAYSDLK